MYMYGLSTIRRDAGTGRRLVRNPYFQNRRPLLLSFHLRTTDHINCCLALHRRLAVDGVDSGLPSFICPLVHR